MTNNKLHKTEKQEELEKYCVLVLTTLDYYLEDKAMQMKIEDLDASQYYQDLKIQTEEHFQKGRLAKLKQWFRDLTEMQVETGNLKFNKYLQDKTKYEIDIFKSYFQRVDKIIEKGKITTDSQFYDINRMVDQLCQSESKDNERIGILGKLLSEYEQRKSRK